jgi:thiol:disulfide interchange protein DsbD
MLLYAFLGLGFSLYLGAFEKDGHIFKRTFSFILFIYSLALFIGFLGGSTSMVKPLSFLQTSVVQNSALASKALDFKVIHSQEELDALLTQNKGKKILLDFSAQWCTACKELEEKTFSNPQVQQALNGYLLVRADVTQNTPQEKALSKNYGVFGPPVVLFFNEQGELLKSKTIVGFVEPEEFLKHLH